MSIGPHRLEYEVIEGWERLPEGWSFVEVAGVAVDAAERVYVFCRGEHPVIVFDKEGRFLSAWGEGVFARPHGIFIDPAQRVHCVDCDDHTIRTFTTDGTLLETLGEPHVASQTGFAVGASPVQHGAGPFNMVTNVVVLPDGSKVVTDGYGNARVHRFAPDGTLAASWGEPGSGPGQFNLPHGLAVDRAGRIYVADRENSRVQIFSPAGEYLDEWGWVGRPCDVFIDAQDRVYIAELGFRVANQSPVHFRFMERPPPGHDPIARVTVCDPDGQIITRIGGEEEVLPGNFIAPHGLWVDPKGRLYVGEVVVRSGAAKRLAPLPVQAFQVFQRRAG
jgi:DNA-binding beta-propeller fold protein YncE